MKAKRQRQRGIPFTAHDARVFQGIFDALEGRYGDEVRLYMKQYIKLKAQSYKLEKKGLKVRIALPDFPRRPLLIIEK
jgi:hypothetical protein